MQIGDAYDINFFAENMKFINVRNQEFKRGRIRPLKLQISWVLADNGHYTGLYGKNQSIKLREEAWKVKVQPLKSEYRSFVCYKIHIQSFICRRLNNKIQLRKIIKWIIINPLGLKVLSQMSVIHTIWEYFT